MTLVTDRHEAMEYMDLFRESKASMAVFCTSSHWNTEAILLAGRRIAERYGLTRVPLAVATTFTYQYMPQAKRATYSGDEWAGFVSLMGHLAALCEGPHAPYAEVAVVPHLDHADPTGDRRALTEGLPYLGSVMFDAQRYAFDDNLARTREYVEAYGKQVLVEGIIEELSVAGQKQGARSDAYVEKAVRYVDATGVDFLVADLGTEQQSTRIGGARYLKERALELTNRFGEARLVLHGTSCLSDSEMHQLPEDGILRVNMWTRIVREAGQAAARQLLLRRDAVEAGDFEASESRQYLHDSIETAATIMVGIMEAIGYPHLKI